MREETDKGFKHVPNFEEDAQLTKSINWTISMGAGEIVDLGRLGY